MRTRLVLIRHGQTVHNAAGLIAGWIDSPLSDFGRAQAAQVASYVDQHYRLAAVYSSPLGRARQTAEAVAAPRGHAVRLIPGLREVHFGDLEGLTHAEAAGLFPGIWEQLERDDAEEFRWPNGETLREFRTRIHSALGAILARHAGETVAVVAHGGVIGCYAAELYEGRPQAWARYVPANCSLTEVEAVDDWVCVSTFDQCSFLVDENLELARASLTGALAGAGVS